MSRIHSGARSALRRPGRIAVLAILALAFAFTATAGAAFTRVNVVSQGEPPPGPLPSYVHYYKTIQTAVTAGKTGTIVLIEPGTYDEEVKVTRPQAGIYIRGMNRNTVVLDGQNKPLPGGSNGIEVFKANDVWIENLTARNFDRASADGPGGNEIWWNGGEGSEKIGAHGWFGSYLTAYDTGLNGGYGIFTNNEKQGSWENIYASGMNDSGMYLGACGECEANITKAVMENNALGYSGSNSGGKLVIENSVFNHNTDGIAPNSENPGDGPPPQNGACEHKPYTKAGKKLPEFTSTEFAHCTFFRNNKVEDNNNLNAPDNGSSAAAPWGAGIELPGTYGDVVEGNTINGNPNNGILQFEYPNPFPPTAQTIYFQDAGNRVVDNTFEGNGYLGGNYAGDVMFEGGLFGAKRSTQDCFAGNTFTSTTWPHELEGTWNCSHSTTPNSTLTLPSVAYLQELQGASESRTPEDQPAPPEQETMPNPCEGVPVNPLCP